MRTDTGESLDELRIRVEALSASQARVVAAADAERRRIERALHDGVQQELVALAVNLQLVRRLVEPDPAGAKTLIEELSADVRGALTALQELAQRIYPALLAPRGLAEALRAAASEAGLRARIEAGQLGRHPCELEETLYFSCLEALLAVAGRPGAGAQATVRLWEEPGLLGFEISDDGPALERRPAEPVAELTAVSDRLGAWGGRLTISSGTDLRTRVAGTIPLAP